MNEWMPIAEASKIANPNGDDWQARKRVMQLIADGVLDARCFRKRDVFRRYPLSCDEEIQSLIEQSKNLADAKIIELVWSGTGDPRKIDDFANILPHEILRFMRTQKDSTWTSINLYKTKTKIETWVDWKNGEFKHRLLSYSRTRFPDDEEPTGYCYSETDWHAVEVSRIGVAHLLQSNIGKSLEAAQTGKRKGGRPTAQHGEAIARVTLLLKGLAPADLKRYTATSLALELMR